MENEFIKVNSEIQQCEIEIQEAAANVFNSTGKDKQYWMTKENALRFEKNALRTKENALRTKDNALRDKGKDYEYFEGITNLFSKLLHVTIVQTLKIPHRC